MNQDNIIDAQGYVVILACSHSIINVVEAVVVEDNDDDDHILQEDHQGMSKILMAKQDK